MSQAPFTIQPRLTAIAMAYRNQDLVADMLLPRVRVDSPTFKYSKYALADGFTIPDTRVGRKSAVNQIDWTAARACSAAAGSAAIRSAASTALTAPVAWVTTSRTLVAPAMLRCWPGSSGSCMTRA